MSLLLSKKHLRVEIPQTIDGMNALIGDDGRVVLKTVFLPFTAKRVVESNQAKKPKHLQAKITVVEGDFVQKGTVKETGEFTPEQLAKLKAMTKEATKNKGGRPKKQVTETDENN